MTNGIWPIRVLESVGLERRARSWLPVGVRMTFCWRASKLTLEEDVVGTREDGRGFGGDKINLGLTPSEKRSPMHLSSGIRGMAAWQRGGMLGAGWPSLVHACSHASELRNNGGLRIFRDTVSTGLPHTPVLWRKMDAFYFWPCMYEEGANRAARRSFLESRYRGERHKIRAIVVPRRGRTCCSRGSFVIVIGWSSAG